MLAVREEVAPVEGERLWIRVGEPARLRDYFLRLGVEAEIVASGAGSVVLVHGEEPEIRVSLESWATINETEVSVLQTSAAVAPAIRLDSSSRPRLGDLLLAKGMISAAQLEEALVLSRDGGELLGRVLLRRQSIFEDELARTLAEQLELPYVNLRHTGIDFGVARLVPSETGVRYAAIPISVQGDRIRVAFSDPCDEQARQAVTTHVHRFVPVVAELSDIEQAWRSVERRGSGV